MRVFKTRMFFTRTTSVFLLFTAVKMDPLSVGASIAGLLSITFKITSTLCRVACDAPRLVQSVVYETQALGAIFYQLQNYVMGVGKLPQHTNMIAIEQVVGILTACVCTFSELEKEIDNLQEGVRGKTKLLKPMDLVRWMFSGESALKGLLMELQMQKASLALMLNILHSQSDSQAYESLTQLHSRFDELVQSNKELSSRLKRIEKSTLVEASAPDSLSSISSAALTGRKSDVRRTSSSSRPRPYSSRQSVISRISILTTFEEVLQRSRVYNKNKAADILFGVDSRASANYTVLSGLTLSNISNLSVFELPLCANELSSRVWFGEDWEENPHIKEIRRYYARNHSHALTNPGSTSSHIFFARALRPYTALGPHELSLITDDSVLMVYNPDFTSSYWLVETWDKRTGLVPSSILLLLPHEQASLKFPFKAIATHSYQADHRDPNMLSFVSGEVLDTCENDASVCLWWRARKKNGECGLVPMNFMEIVHPKISDEKTAETPRARMQFPEIPRETKRRVIVRPKEKKKISDGYENQNDAIQTFPQNKWVNISIPNSKFCFEMKYRVD
ncbi:hypothetical protein EDC01DRAFT_512865 [Geopyxis carbonaria]|nr:hypothetical protein EDC01DRAFT_512865 [Geopyxis carbonaria]